MSVHGQLLDITVTGCSNLKDTEWISRQDPYVILDYAGNKYRTKTDTDGGRNPSFNEKYMLPLIEGLREINVAVWNSNTLSPDDFIGSGKILLQKVLTDGYHDSTWPLTTKSGRRAGEIRIILHKGAHKVMPVAQQTAALHQTPPLYPPSNPVQYPPATYGSAPPYPPPPQSSDCSCYPPIYPTYPPHEQTPYPNYGGAGGYTAPAAYGSQPPYPCPPQSYPPPLYPPQGYGGYGARPAGYYPPPY